MEIVSATTLSKKEIVAELDELTLKKLGELTDLRQDSGASKTQLDDLNSQVEVLRSALRETKQSDSVADARKAAEEGLGRSGESTAVLDDRRYRPKEVSVYAGDFSGKLLPKLLFELDEEKREEITDAKEYLNSTGWTLVADSVLPQVLEKHELSFETLKATHVLLLVKSNHGAGRVKIDEVRVMTSESMPEGSREFAGDVWPNVAAVGYKPSVGWLFLAYIILTSAEVMVSITCLEFSYTQAPKKMKSFIMAIFLLSISLGNTFTALVNKFIQNEDGSSKLAGASYFWFFVIVMVVTAVLFIPIAARYKVKDHIQDEASEETEG
jgi:hypothetical protein